MEEPCAPHDAGTSWIGVVKELVAGTVGGCAGIVAGQPLDTVKLRMQAPMSPYRSATQCFVNTVKLEGARALYKGMGSPLAANAPINAIIFATYGSSLRLMAARWGPAASDATQYERMWVAGSIGGFLQSFVMTPMELVKCKLQAQGSAGVMKSNYAGPIDCIKRRTALLGWRIGLYRGFWATVLRDTPSFGAWFATYEIMKALVLRHVDVEKNRAAHYAGLISAGGVAGIAGWIVTFPLDTIKSVIQTLPDTTHTRDFRLSVVAGSIFKQGGVAGFYRGVWPTMVRAFPTNAVIFAVYELTIKQLHRLTYDEDR